MSRYPLNVSAVLPAFNEELNLDKTVTNLTQVLTSLAQEWEIIVVNDGSKDRTLEVLNGLRLKLNDRLVIHSHPVNLGYGAALQSGVSCVKYEWVFITDSDGQFVLEELDKFIRKSFEGFTFVQGFRANRQDSLFRVYLGKTYKFVMRLVFPTGVTDPECSFRFLRNDLIKSITLTSKGALLPVELVYKCRKAGAIICQMPITHLSRQFGTSSALSGRSLKKFFVEVVKLFYSIHIKK